MHALLERQKVDALLLKRVSSFAWATCGATSHVNIADCYGKSQLLITKNKRFLITDNIEVPRLLQEEKLSDQRWEIIASDWHSTEQTLCRLAKGLKLGCDSTFLGAVDLSKNLAQLRAQLTLPEIKRFKKLAQLCAQAGSDQLRPRPG